MFPGFEGLMPYFQHTADRATLDASEGLQTFLRPSSGKDAQVRYLYVPLFALHSPYNNTALLACLAPSLPLRSSTKSILQAGHSGCSTTDGEDEWPQSHLGFDQHGHHLNAASFLDATTGPAPYLYSKDATS